MGPAREGPHAAADPPLPTFARDVPVLRPRRASLASSWNGSAPVSAAGGAVEGREGKPKDGRNSCLLLVSHKKLSTFGILSVDGPVRLSLPTTDPSRPSTETPGQTSPTGKSGPPQGRPGRGNGSENPSCGGDGRGRESRLCRPVCTPRDRGSCSRSTYYRCWSFDQIMQRYSFYEQ